MHEYRPEYPQELVNSIIELSRLPIDGLFWRSAAATGKATRLFARRGYAVHCIEPGANLAAVAARNLKDHPQITFENTRFEDWQERLASFDLVMSAQAFHWFPARSATRKQPVH